MTTNELIELLKKNDPSGKLPVSINNCDVEYVQLAHANQNGWFQCFDGARDRNNGSILEFNKASYIGTGYKIVIQPISFADAFVRGYAPKIEIVGNDKNGHHQALIESWKTEFDCFSAKPRIGKKQSITPILDNLEFPEDDEDEDEDDFDDELELVDDTEPEALEDHHPVNNEAPRNRYSATIEYLNRSGVDASEPF